MFKKKTEDGEPTDGGAKQKRDEHAYEDAWYRALKAQAEQRLGGDEDAAESAED
jgi:hypothetical protein